MRRAYEDIDHSTYKALKTQSDVIIVDVREEWEFEEFNEGGFNIPLATIRDNREQLASYNGIIVVCTNGTRSKVAAMDYCRITEWADKKIYHLHGGLLGAE